MAGELAPGLSRGPQSTTSCVGPGRAAVPLAHGRRCCARSCYSPIRRGAKLDLIYVDGVSNLVVHAGDGSGSFGAAVPFPVGAGPVALAVVDFNRDGKLDLITANAGDGTLSLLKGDGAGGIQTTASLSTAASPSALAILDLNRDGIPDVAVASSSAGTVSVHFGNGSGGFGPPVTFPAGRSPIGLATADFDGDGVPDLAVASSLDRTLTILLGN